MKVVIDTAFDEEKLEGKIETAESLISLGIEWRIISKSTGFSIEEIEKL